MNHMASAAGLADGLGVRRAFIEIASGHIRGDHSCDHLPLLRFVSSFVELPLEQIKKLFYGSSLCERLSEQPYFRPLESALRFASECDPSKPW